MPNAINIKGEQTEHALVKTPANIPRNPNFDFVVTLIPFPNCNVNATEERIVNKIKKARFSKVVVSVYNSSPCNNPGILMKFIRNAAAIPTMDIDKTKIFLLGFLKIISIMSLII